MNPFVFEGQRTPRCSTAAESCLAAIGTVPRTLFDRIGHMLITKKTGGVQKPVATPTFELLFVPPICWIRGSSKTGVGSRSWDVLLKALGHESVDQASQIQAT